MYRTWALRMVMGIAHEESKKKKKLYTKFAGSGGKIQLRAEGKRSGAEEKCRSLWRGNIPSIWGGLPKVTIKGKKFLKKA